MLRSKEHSLTMTWRKYIFRTRQGKHQALFSFWAHDCFFNWASVLKKEGNKTIFNLAQTGSFWEDYRGKTNAESSWRGSMYSYWVLHCRLKEGFRTMILKFNRNSFCCSGANWKKMNTTAIQLHIFVVPPDTGILPWGLKTLANLLIFLLWLFIIQTPRKRRCQLI